MIKKKYRGIIVCGRPGAGKTTFVKRMIKAYSGGKMIYDIHNEYKDGVIMDMDKFLDIVVGLSLRMVVFEEATIFFDNKGSDKKIRELLVNKRHSGTTNVFVFHTLQSIPSNLISLCDLLVLFKTNDNTDLLATKFKTRIDIMSGFVENLEESDEHSKKFVRLGG